MTTPDELLQRTSEFILRSPALSRIDVSPAIPRGLHVSRRCALVPYLHDLGITHCYASPYLQARPGSSHGYDITDHRRSIQRSARSKITKPGLASYTRTDGPDSRHCAQSHGHRRQRQRLVERCARERPVVSLRRLLRHRLARFAPGGAAQIASCCRPRRALRQGRSKRGNCGWSTRPAPSRSTTSSITFRFAAQLFLILGHDVQELETWLGAEATRARRIQEHPHRRDASAGPQRDGPRKSRRAQREKEVVKRPPGRPARGNTPRCATLSTRRSPLFNGKAGEPHSFDLLDRLLDEQAYRLSFWRVAADEINYRRFFDINELAALSMEKLEVFTATHELVLRLLSQRQSRRPAHRPSRRPVRSQAVSAASAAVLRPCLRPRGLRPDPQYHDQDWKDWRGRCSKRLRRRRKAAGAAVRRRREDPRCGRDICRPTGRRMAPAATISSTSLNGLFVDRMRRRAVDSLSTSELDRR